MTAILFNTRAIPRTLTREQWRQIERQRRILERVIRAEMERVGHEIEQRLANLHTFGTTHPEIMA